jgi:hypothetical protein
MDFFVALLKHYLKINKASVCCFTTTDSLVSSYPI